MKKSFPGVTAALTALSSVLKGTIPTPEGPKGKFIFQRTGRTHRFTKVDRTGRRWYHVDILHQFAKPSRYTGAGLRAIRADPLKR
jgi:hypothetical protein